MYPDCYQDIILLSSLSLLSSNVMALHSISDCQVAMMQTLTSLLLSFGVSVTSSAVTHIQALSLWGEALRASPDNYWICAGEFVAETQKLTSRLVRGCIMATWPWDIEWNLWSAITSDDDNDVDDDKSMSW